VQYKLWGGLKSW